MDENFLNKLNNIKKINNKVKEYLWPKKNNSKIRRNKFRNRKTKFLEW